MMKKSIWAEVFGLGNRKKRTYRSLVKSRPLRMEPLEQRQLLSIDTGIGQDDPLLAELDNEVVETLPSLRVRNATVVEGDEIFFKVRLSSPHDEPVKVRYQTINATAKRSDADFQHTSGMLYFAPGMTEGIVGVPTGDDGVAEGDEHFWFLLADPTNATIC